MKDINTNSKHDDLCSALSGAGLVVRSALGAAQHTTMGVGGEFEYFIEVDTEQVLAECLRLLSSSGQTYRFLGFGSNVVVCDQGLSGWTIKLGPGFRSIEKVGENEFVLGASTSLMSLSRKISGAGFSGLEFAGGIPASLGGAVKMNAGAHGSDMSELLTSVSVLHPNGECEVIEASSLSFSYRHCALPENSVVISARIKVVSGDRDRISALLRDNLRHRRETQPLQLPSAGSVFKNPSPEIPAGRLIDQCGLRGYRRGGARVSELHGNWIVNPERTASYSDVCDLIAICQEKVSKHHGIELEPELICWLG